ncbi:hypothetical protein K443DRAFT_5853 [Laccaria amethystina LaAM-08-1]|uniref:Uncharacterized protein n=1 Tax=Laccaria amethystina LaAM-08-1 TaxID=1095629 RepID=A0A0C9WUG1_9AGAR|nr:hypothetical protein K443DRAFT_5853 [Laccaria amethystina LaAM-08-1]
MSMSDFQTSIPMVTRVSDIPHAVDLPPAVEDDHLEVQSIHIPLPPTLPVGPFPVPSPTSSSSDLEKPVNPPKASALHAK